MFHSVSFNESFHITYPWAGVMVKMVDAALAHLMLVVVLYLMCCYYHRRRRRHRWLSEQFHLYDVRALLVSFLSLNPIEIHRKTNKAQIWNHISWRKSYAWNSGSIASRKETTLMIFI